MKLSVEKQVRRPHKEYIYVYTKQITKENEIEEEDPRTHHRISRAPSPYGDPFKFSRICAAHE